MENPQGTPSPWPPSAVTLVVAALLLAIIAFTLGNMLGSNRPSDVVVDDLSGDISTEPVDDASDEKDQASTSADLSDGVSVEWFAPEDQGEIDFNFYLRQWVESGDTSEIIGYSGRILGIVENANYYGDYLVANTVTRGGMGETGQTFYLIVHQKDDKQPVLLTRYVTQEPFFGILTSQSTFSEGAVSGMTLSDALVPAFERLPQLIASDGAMTFTFLGTGEYIARASMIQRFPVKAQSTSGIDLRLYTPIDGVELTGMAHQFFTLADDGRTLRYDLDIPFWTANTGNTGVPMIRWDNGTLPGVPDYLKGAIGGCGSVSPTNVVTEIPELIITGHAVEDESILVYEPKDYGDPLVQGDYDSWKFRQENAEAATVEVFGSDHPLFYYQDQLGRWIKFIRSDAILAAECGKPVIYLYPPTTTDISVTLAPQGGFTKSEPAYNEGWNVTASPDGRLVNHADGQTYPYLFWEGRGGLYSAPKDYWVVAQADVHSFLTTTLAKLGLNAKETADFIEFWEPRMQAAPYYKIGFHGTNVMNVIAPLSTCLHIDTLLRVLMDYEELDAPIAAHPPKLPSTPVRRGFTVIEWGGVIR